MKVICVPHARFVTSDPQHHQGVELTREMLAGGIWHTHTAHADVSETTIKSGQKVFRSDQEHQYIAALSALLEIEHDPRTFGVVSMRWCSETERLIMAEKVWVGIFHGHGNAALIHYSHRISRHQRTVEMRTFLEMWEDVDSRVLCDAAWWKVAFANELEKRMRLIA